MTLSHLLIINTYRHETFIKNYPPILGKINLVSLLIGCIALLASCQNDEGEPLSTDEPRTVTLTLNLPEAMTRSAVSAEEMPTRYLMQVIEDGTPGAVQDITSTRGATLTLYETRSYEFLFWADQGDIYYTATDLQNIRSATATGASMGIAYMSHYTWDGSASANITLDFAVSKITLINTTSTLWRDNTVSVTLEKAYSGISVKDGVTGTAAAYTYTQEITSDVAPGEDIATFYVLTKAGEEQDITVKCNSTTIATVTTTPDPGKYLTLSGNIGGASTEPSTGVELTVSIGEWEDVAIELDKLLTDATQPSTSLQGSGIEEDPYLIRSAADLLHYSESSTYRNGYTRLETDIEVAASSWTPLNTLWYGGTFDGNGHTISGTLNITPGQYNGLFASIRGNGLISNLNVTADINMSGVSDVNYIEVGGIAGSCDNGSISHCTYSGTITLSTTGTARSIDIGGICGFGGNANISNCTNSGTVMVENCSNNDGSLKQLYAGGISGCSSLSTLSQCTHSGIMQVSGCTTNALWVGGIAGYNVSGNSISQCIHSGTVTEENNTVSGTKYLGGIAGCNKGTLTDNDCSQGTPDTPVGNE